MISYGDIKSGEAALPVGESVRDLDLDLSQIKLDQSAQPRESLNNDRIAEYAEAMKAGDQFPPLTVFHDGETYWLADGFHRHYAAQHAGRKHVRCYVRQGGLRDAILWSVGANAKHGLARSQADKERAVLRLLNDDEWGQWSDREIAKRCHVDHKTVARIRKDASGEFPQIERKAERGGTVYTQKVAKAKPAVVAENAPTEVTIQEFSIFKASEPEAAVESTTPEDHQFEELQRAWNVAGEGARVQFLVANNLQFQAKASEDNGATEPQDEMREAADSMAGDVSRSTSATNTGEGDGRDVEASGGAASVTTNSQSDGDAFVAVKGMARLANAADVEPSPSDTPSAPPAEAAPAFPKPPAHAGAVDNSPDPRTPQVDDGRPDQSSDAAGVKSGEPHIVGQGGREPVGYYSKSEQQLAVKPQDRNEPVSGEPASVTQFINLICQKPDTCKWAHSQASCSACSNAAMKTRDAA